MLKKMLKAIKDDLWEVRSNKKYVQSAIKQKTREDRFVEDVWDYADSFDPEEHVEMWVMAKAEARRENHAGHGIPAIATLADDAEAINAMLEELASALQDAEPIRLESAMRDM